MPNGTYTLIASNTLTGTAATVTFSNIPQTYTDLVVRWSARDTWADYASGIYITFNGTTSSYSDTHLTGLNGAASAASSRNTGAARLEGFSTAGTATANTFSSGEIYIPSYTVSQNKPASTYTVAENNNANNAVIDVAAGLWQITSAITEVKFSARTNFNTGSSFFIYGVKNS